MRPRRAPLLGGVLPGSREGLGVADQHKAVAGAGEEHVEALGLAEEADVGRLVRPDERSDNDLALRRSGAQGLVAQMRAVTKNRV